MNRPRLALLAALAALFATGTFAKAAPRPLVSDPKGDHVPLGAGYDIVSANLSTTGTTKRVGRRTVYAPTALIATVTMAGPPPTTAGTRIGFLADISACGRGYISWSYLPGTREGSNNAFVSGCGDVMTTGGLSAYYGDNATVKGNTITWRLRLKELGKDLPLETTFTNLEATVDIADPYNGLYGTDVLGLLPGTVDYASSDATYTLR